MQGGKGGKAWIFYLCGEKENGDFISDKTSGYIFDFIVYYVERKIFNHENIR